MTCAFLAIEKRLRLFWLRLRFQVYHCHFGLESVHFYFNILKIIEFYISLELKSCIDSNFIYSRALELHRS